MNSWDWVKSEKLNVCGRKRKVREARWYQQSDGWSGVDNAPSMREAWETLMWTDRSWYKDKQQIFWHRFPSYLKIQRINFSSSDLMISNDDLIYSDNKKEEFSVKRKKKKSQSLAWFSLPWVLVELLRTLSDPVPSVLMVEGCHLHVLLVSSLLRIF